ncbi:MAG TPA: 50S ribosomal protein L9 [Patescibacteria group bacterium]
MKVILLQDVKNLGRKWDVKEVSDGYARNFLLPKKLTEIATKTELQKIEKLKEKEAIEEKKDLEKIQALADQLQGKAIVIKAKNKDGKLFGSITTKDIVKELKKENIVISAKALTLEMPIKEIGEFEIRVNLEHGIETQLSVIIEEAE